MKIAIILLPFPPITGTAAPSAVHQQNEMIDEAAMNTLGGVEAAADQEVIVAMFPDGSHRVVKNRDDAEVTVIPR